MTEQVYGLNKKRLVLLILGAVVFVVLGVWCLSSASVFNQIVGIACIAFFGLAAVLCLKKLLDKSPGLVVNAEGIVDNASGVAAGLIPWAEVSNIDSYAIQGQQFVAIQVSDPDKYIERGSALKKVANRANMKLVGTPLTIPATALQVSFDELQETLQSYYAKSLEPGH